MPTYDHVCKECGETIALMKRISERDNSSEDICPKCNTKGSLNRVVAAPLIAYSVTTKGGYGKVPDGFKEVLNKVHKVPGARPTSSFL